MAWTRNRTRLIAIVLIVIVIATSIALRKTVPDQSTRVAIGTVEIVLIAILVVGFVRPGLETDPLPTTQDRDETVLYRFFWGDSRP